MPSHCYRMRVFDRDLIRGGHYGQRSCEPHRKAEHMAAPTNAAKREKSSCQHGAVTLALFGHGAMSAMSLVMRAKADIKPTGRHFRFGPQADIPASQDPHRVGTVVPPMVEQSRSRFQAMPCAAAVCRAAFSCARVASSREMFSWRRWLFSSRRWLVSTRK